MVTDDGFPNHPLIRAEYACRRYFIGRAGCLKRYKNILGKNKMRASHGLLAAVVVLILPGQVMAHGFAGKRFFPATLATDDPFVADELSLPTISSIVTRDEGGTRDTELSVDIAKRITPNFCIDAGATFIMLHPPGERALSGFGNLEL